MRTHRHTHSSTAKGRRFQQYGKVKGIVKELNKPGQCLMDAANGGSEQFSFMTFHRLCPGWELGIGPGGRAGGRLASLQ